MLATLALSASLLGAGGGLGAAAPRPQSRLLVYAQEWSLWPSRTTFTAGHLAITVWNRGQDPHDLRVRPLSNGRLTAAAARGIAPVASGAMVTGSWDLPPGRYELFCALPGHAHLGMHTVITVR